MQIFAGTSGYSYAPWKGSFYPEKLPAAKMLGYYAGRLPTVEINNTFYRVPAREAVAKWATETPPSFRFAVKAPKRITHDRRLVDTEDALVHFAGVADALGPQLGPVLFQLPPNLRKDLPRLEAFLHLLKAKAPSLRAAFEFRHPTWFDDEVNSTLAAGGAALCIADAEDLTTPVAATAGWGYLRLRRQDYDDAAVAAWAERIRAQPWGETYVFFKHEDEGRGPRLAETLLNQVGAVAPVIPGGG
ncbi:MAG TPA: DUF72 domain-containing protein [Polyangia bacterium]